MSSIPSGLVTFLFTDIEGSTKLAQSFPATLQHALEKHHEIMREAIESNNGYIFEIVGDAFCTAFADASDALKAAYEVQKNLTAENWDEVVIKVRIGIHSGDAEWTDKKYRGYITLARTARVMSAAYGGQVLLSDRTLELITEKTGIGSITIQNNSEAARVSFRNLGERRLKDLIQPIVLYQLLAPQLESEFPPLNTLDARPNNLPVQLTSFIGREKEMAIVKKLLNETHLLTLMGSGGSGKSRLSLQAGADVIDDFAHGVWLVELAQLSETTFILPEIASALNISLDSEKKIIDVIVDFLREKEMLIIIDNCEHLIDDCATIINTLLSSCRKLKILVSSREALRISGEKTYKVSSFELPDLKKKISAESIIEFDAVRLFADRAVSIRNDFKITDANSKAIAQLCYQLDGIPLAIELAAARIRVLSVEEISEKLINKFSLLTGGNRTALPRQKTLRAMIDWSYDLLSDTEKILFERLSIFSGGWYLEAAEEICSDDKLDQYEVLDLITNLVDKSIITVRESQDENRFGMLQTIREYAHDKFKENEGLTFFQKKHFTIFSKLAEHSETKLSGNERNIWIKRLESDLDNIRDSLKWGIRSEPGPALDMALGLCHFWNHRFYYSEGLEFLNSILDSDTEDQFERSRYARGLYWKGNFLLETGEIDMAKSVLEKSRTIYNEINDIIGLAETTELIGVIAYHEADYQKARQLLDESLASFRSLNLKKNAAHALMSLGGVEYMQTNYEASKKIVEESLELYREINDRNQIGKVTGNLGIMEFQMGNYPEALKLLEEYLSISREQENKKGITMSLLNISYVHIEQQQLGKAKELQEESLKIGNEIGNKNLIALSLISLASTEQKMNNLPESKQLYLQSLRLFNELKDKYQVIECIINLSSVYLAMGEHKQTVILLSAFDKLYKIIDTKMNKINSDIFEKTYDEAKSRLPVNEFESYWETGQTVTFENVNEFTDVK